MSALVSKAEVHAVAREFGIDPNVFYRQIKQESGLRKHIGSPMGAQGPAQLMPATAKALGVNINDWKDNLRGGAKYLRQQLDAFGGDYEQALRAYNSGPGNARSGASKGFAETNHYVDVILGGYKKPGSGSVRATARKGTSRAAQPARGASTGRSGDVTIPGSPELTTTGPITQDTSARAQAAMAFLGHKMSLSGLAQNVAAIGEQERAAATVTTLATPDQVVPGAKPADVAATGPKTRGAHSDQTRHQPRDRSIQIEAGADRAGVSTQAIVKNFLRGVSGRTDVPVDVGTGTNHSQFARGGNQSDHWTGHGADLLVGGDMHGNPKVESRGDRLAAHAIQEATGKNYAQSLAIARQGGIHNFSTPKGRVQIIWKAQDHYDHVHVGIR